MESADNCAPSWEACKENVIPLKRGRSAKGLSEVLSRNIDSASGDALREKAFEDSLLVAAKLSGKELLNSYTLYFKWLRDTFPSNSERALKLLEVFRIFFMSAVEIR